MKVIVASNNPVKIDAVRQAFQICFPGEIIEIIPIESPSGVSEQPMSASEAVEGAINRAQNVSHHETTDYTVGIEGGLHFVKVGTTEHCFEQAWACVIDRATGKYQIGSTPAYPVPAHVLELLRQGKDLTEAMDTLYGIKDIGTSQGYTGWLTDNLVDRTLGAKIATIIALSTLKKGL